MTDTSKPIVRLETSSAAKKAQKKAVAEAKEQVHDTLADVPDIWRRLEEVGLHSKQTGMDNVRGVCGCPVAGLTPHELLDASPVIRELDDLLLGNK